MMLPVVLLCVAAFALAAALGCYAARLICLGVEPLPDGPPSGVLGAIAAVRGLPPIMLAIFCFVCGILAAIWYADTVRGIVPDVFTLLPLAAIGIAAGFSGRWDVIVSALVPTIPFAIVAYASKGRGMGWGDVKLAALGGALLGMQNAVLAFALASIVAIVVSRFRADRTRPMALAPYLVAGIAVPLALQAAVR
jgi:prepilin signal peptidase PulO-like enzyme (type II secretory pathway)